jgi:hypothetical protein
MMFNRALFVSLFILFGVGCAQSRTYYVAVSNKTDQPLTIGYAKFGGPMEPALASPEAAGISSPGSNEDLWPSVVAEPGKLAESKVEGKFNSGSELTLRIYAGKLKLSQVLAISRGQPNRIDLPLEPGINRFRVTSDAGKLVAEPVAPRPGDPKKLP